MNGSSQISSENLAFIQIHSRSMRLSLNLYTTCSAIRTEGAKRSAKWFCLFVLSISGSLRTQTPTDQHLDMSEVLKNDRYPLKVHLLKQNYMPVVNKENIRPKCCDNSHCIGCEICNLFPYDSIILVYRNSLSIFCNHFPQSAYNRYMVDRGRWLYRKFIIN